MHLLFLFFDGIGLGLDDPETNPFAAQALPTLTQFTADKKWLAGLPRIESDHASFIPTDANLGVQGKPQSGTGQATIMTGINVSQAIGRHYGPKPNPEIAEIVRRKSMITKLIRRGYSAGMLNAYPSRFLEGIASGQRLMSSNQLALHSAGVAMRDGAALIEGRALSADFTGEMWREHAANFDAASTVWRTRPNTPDTPVFSADESGKLIAKLAMEQDFTFFDCWLTDYIGHRGTHEDAMRLLRIIDGVFAGLLESWDTANDLILVTSDHGNLEALAERGHTRNLVPTLVIGERSHEFAATITDLTHIAPAILRMFP